MSRADIATFLVRQLTDDGREEVMVSGRRGISASTDDVITIPLADS